MSVSRQVWLITSDTPFPLMHVTTYPNDLLVVCLSVRLEPMPVLPPSPISLTQPDRFVPLLSACPHACLPTLPLPPHSLPARMPRVSFLGMAWSNLLMARIWLGVAALFAQHRWLSWLSTLPCLVTLLVVCVPALVVLAATIAFLATPEDTVRRSLITFLPNYTIASQHPTSARTAQSLSPPPHPRPLLAPLELTSASLPNPAGPPVPGRDMSGHGRALRQLLHRLRRRHHVSRTHRLSLTSPAATLCWR